MLIGHFAVACATKKAVPKVSLGTLCPAAQSLYAANRPGPPPPDAYPIAVVGNATRFFIFGAFRVGRHRLEI
jgi:hypothetical protein